MTSSKRTKAGAVISDCGRYRYHLLRVWDDSLPRICWIMLNPSTADAEQDDPTIRRCMGFSKAWGAGGMEVVNLFALRSTDPKELRKVAYQDAIGPENDNWICQRAASPEVSKVIAAWGRHGEYMGRDQEILPLLGSRIEQVGPGDYPRHPQPESVKESHNV